MKLLIPFRQRQSVNACQVGYPTIGKRFEWLMSLATIWLLVGLYLDGWAHNNIPDLIETFFTPWHAVLYSGFGATALVLAGTYLHNVLNGYPWRRGLPRPLMWSLLGIFIFGLAGNVDLLWHELFGFEEDVEALLSPSHLTLATGGVMITSGLLRTYWQQHSIRVYGRFLTFLPTYISFFTVVSIITFFGQFANLFTHPQLFTSAAPVGDPFYWDVTLISSVLLPTWIWMGFILVLLRRWTVPFGTLTVTFFGNAVLMLLLNWDQSRPSFLILLAPLVIGLLGDTFLKTLQHSSTSIIQLRVFSFLLPFVLFTTIFTILITTYGIWWSIHMWLGVSFLAGIVGLGLSFLILAPAYTAVSPWYTQIMEDLNHEQVNVNEN